MGQTEMAEISIFISYVLLCFDRASCNPRRLYWLPHEAHSEYCVGQYHGWMDPKAPEYFSGSGVAS